MKAISTKYHGPTDVKGARITADDGDGNRITVSYDHSASMGAEVHSIAAIALCRKMNWTGRLISGSTKDGYVFVFATSDSYDIEG